MQNCGVRRLSLDFRDQYFGCEIELTGINRATAAQTLADLFGTCAEHSGGGYDAYRVKDLDGKEWKIVRDSSIHPECRRRSVLIGETYKVELNSPKLEYGEMEKLQEVVRALRRAGGIVNDSCGMHVHVDASKHTPQSLKNVLFIMYSKEDILFAALKVNPARIDSYCQAVDEPILEEIRKLPSGASMLASWHLTCWCWWEPSRAVTASLRKLWDCKEACAWKSKYRKKSAITTKTSFSA